MNESTIATARQGHPLLVAGVLKEKSKMLPDIEIGYCRLQFQDDGVGTSDPFLRGATAEFPAPEFTSVTGLSGSPVYDLAQDRLCGMVMRGGMTGNRSSLLYMDIADIEKCLKAISAGAADTYYTKEIMRSPRPVVRSLFGGGDER